MNLNQTIQSQWQKRGLWAWLMSPLSLIACFYSSVKRWAYQAGLFAQTNVSVPVIVVGNITVGGSGKTPLVIYLAKLLKENGYRPGIICRGYKGTANTWPHPVTHTSNATQVGDEAVMLAKLTKLPVVAGPVRAAAAQELIAGSDCDVVISDDGFQHLRLARDIDVVVVDTKRGYGNAWCLPSGPLRERLSSLKAAQMVVCHGSTQTLKSNQYSMHLANGVLQTLEGKPADNIESNTQPMHAVAGIGHPPRFFNLLRDLGYQIIEHAFSDHHHYTPEELRFGDGLSIITTAKDAIKLAALDLDVTVYVLPVKAQLDDQFNTDILKKLKASYA